MAILQGLGRFLEERDPEASLLVNPFNADARVRALTQQLSQDSSPGALADLEDDTEGALAFDRIEARLFSILGEIKRLEDDKPAAQQIVAQSRRLSKTEIYALERSIVWAMEEGRIADAVSDIDTLLRRWPERFAQVSQAFPAILASEAGYEAVLKTIAGPPPWRPALFGVLGASPAGLASAERLLADLETTASPPRPAEISAIIAAYIRLRDYQSAYRLFLFTLNEEERALAGYVFNSEFAPRSLGRPFDWQVQDLSGIDVLMPTAGGAARSGAEIRFLNAPLKDIGLQQIVMLPPGPYNLSATISGRALKLPKGLFWTIVCSDRGGEIARLDIPEGTFENRELTAAFVVPSTGCGMQQLKLGTGLIAESWRFRYQGALTLHAVVIEKVSA